MDKRIIDKSNAFWAHDDVKQPILSISVRDGSAPWDETTPENSYELWEDLDARYKRSRFTMKNTKYFGDAIAMDWINFGPGCLAAMMGSNYVADANTVWFGVGEYFFKDWSNINELRLLEDAPMYKMVIDLTRALAENNDGSYIVGVSDLGGNLDILASLRNTQDVLIDLYDDPEMVLRAVEIIDEAWIKYYTILRNIIKDSGQLGHTTWLGPWCETSYYPLQCDLAAMISPKDFEKFAMPSLKRISDFLDHSLFHLDGPGQIAFLDQLLAVEKIDGIQWVPGDGSSPVFDDKWFPMYKKIQDANKNLVLHGLYTVDDVVKICDNLSPKGLWLNIWLNTEAEAEELLKRCNWS